MVRNEFLLRLMLFFGIFWISKFFFRLLALFVGFSLNTSIWVGIGLALIFAYKMHQVVYMKVHDSIMRNARMTTTVRWLVYLLVGIALFSAIYALVDDKMFTDSGIEDAIFIGEFLDRLKAFAVLICIFVIAYGLTRKLVQMVEFKPLLVQNDLAEQTVSAPTNGEARNKNDKKTIHGSADFIDWREFNPRYNNKTNEGMYDQFEQTGGYVIVPNQIKYVAHTHMVTIAGSGQGKGTSAIIPNLLTRPQNSWIVLDVKGENAAVTARFQREAEQAVYIIDPFGVQTSIGANHGMHTSGYNPLLVGKYLPVEEISDFAFMIAEMFIPESSAKGNSSDSFWADSGRNLIKAYILHLLTDDSITEKHLGKLYEWLRLNQEGEIDLWTDMTINEHTKFAANEIRSISAKGEQTWLGVLSEARRATAFLESSLIRKSLQSDDFDPMLLQTRNSTVYVILPERNLNSHKTWLRLVFGTTLKLCNFTAKRRVNFLMDEFPILGRMDDFLRAFAFGRGQKISCWIFAQSLSQLKDIYGEEGLNTFLSNAPLRQFFGMNDYYTQKYVSDLLGNTTEVTTTGSSGTSQGSNSGSSQQGGFGGISFNSGNNVGTNSGQAEQLISRPLMTAEEVGKLRNEFVILVNGDKYRLPKYPYYQDNIYPGRYDPNPYIQ
ncbi:type IV secretory system conjugative DNA transfer family protein [Nostoc ellipsosporum NOK]|nr:type IV secretory system conjugative DNA transfer family protein [Nostoc ellipsosporum NOK]